MKLMKQGQQQISASIIIVAALALLVLVVLAIIVLKQGQPADGYTISRIPRTQFCDASVDSKALLLKDKSEIIPLYGINQSRMDELVAKYPDATLIDGKHCVGNYISTGGGD